jgi:hypothetical protein
MVCGPICGKIELQAMKRTLEHHDACAAPTGVFPRHCRYRGLIATVLCMFLALPGALGAEKKGMSILVIGDSNTEHAFITLHLADTLRKYLGVAAMGSGYIPLDSSFYAIRYKRYSGITIGYDTVSWKLMDMFEWTRLPPPFVSPNGQWLKSATVNARAAVTFIGNGADVYWLADSLGGTFSIDIDDTMRTVVTTSGKISVRKTAVSGLGFRSHTMRLTVTAIPDGGRVTLLGFDARNDFSNEPKRSVVHNWGNGWCSTQDFLGIDSIVFASGLRVLAPDVVVVLLGTNDHLQDNRSAVDFKAKIISIVNRIKASGIDAGILLVSTFMTNNTSGATFLPQYRATSWPEAASETGVQYWDMSGWFGPWKGYQMMDENHCDEGGGHKIANEMFNQILQRFNASSSADRPARQVPDVKQGALLRNGRLMVRAGSGVSWKVEMYATGGILISRVSGSGPRDIPLHNGSCGVSPGVYLIAARVGALRSVFRAQSLR